MEKKQAVSFLHCKGTVTPDGKQTGKSDSGNREHHLPSDAASELDQLFLLWCCAQKWPRTFPMELDEDSHEDYITWLKILKKYGTACAVNEPFLKIPADQYRKIWKQAGFLPEDLPGVPVYAGFGPAKSAVCFVCYAVNGVFKICPLQEERKSVCEKRRRTSGAYHLRKTVKVSVIIPVYNSSPYIQQCLTASPG